MNLNRMNDVSLKWLVLQLTASIGGCIAAYCGEGSIFLCLFAVVVIASVTRQGVRRP